MKDANRPESIDFSPHSKDFSFKDALSCATRGIISAFSTQRNLRIQSAFSFSAILIGLILQIPEDCWLAVFLCIALVLSLELMNTALESLVDAVSPEWSLFAKRAKDCAAGSVLLSASVSAFIALFIFIPRILDMLT